MKKKFILPLVLIVIALIAFMPLLALTPTAVAPAEDAAVSLVAPVAGIKITLGDTIPASAVSISKALPVSSIEAEMLASTSTGATMTSTGAVLSNIALIASGLLLLTLVAVSSFRQRLTFIVMKTFVTAKYLGGSSNAGDTDNKYIMPA